MPLHPGRVIERVRHGRTSGLPAAIGLTLLLSIAAGLPMATSGAASGDPGAGPGPEAMAAQRSVTLGRRPPAADLVRPTVSMVAAPTDSGGQAWIRTAVGGNGAIALPSRSAIGATTYRVQPAPAALTATVAPAAKAWSGRYNLYRADAFVTQKTFRWCVAASVQMMVNLVRDHTDRTTRTQARMIAYAQRYDDGPYGEDGGTDVTGWMNALRHFGAGRYRAVGATTAAKALRIAATAMRQTGRPAGILVMEGRHAWVLHGFESRADPLHATGASISAVRISGPLYPLQQKGGYDPPPNTRLSVRSLARYFRPSSVGTLAGRYVVVIPTH